MLGKKTQNPQTLPHRVAPAGVEWCHLLGVPR